MTWHSRCLALPVGSGGRPPERQTADVADDAGQRAVVARLPGSAAFGLVAPPGAALVPAPQLADPDWTARVLEARAPRGRPVDRRALATVWWYSASTVLVTPPLAGLVAGIPLPARLTTSPWPCCRGPPDRGARRRGDRGPGRRPAGVAGHGDRGVATRRDARAPAVGHRHRFAGQPAARPRPGRGRPRRGDGAGPRWPGRSASRCPCRGTRRSGEACSPAGPRAACSTSCPPDRCARPAPAVPPRSAAPCSAACPAAGEGSGGVADVLEGDVPVDLGLLAAARACRSPMMFRWIWSVPPPIEVK